MASQTHATPNNKRPILIEIERFHCKRSCMKLYLQEETADVHFVFNTKGEEKRVPAHKCMLATGSPVFKSIFYGNLRDEGDVIVMDTTIDAFKEFLQFFYLADVTITFDNIAEILNLANQYVVVECFTACDAFLKKHLSIDKICFGLELAITYDRSDLRQFCLTKVMEKPIEIFALESFKKCSREILKLILECDYLNCDEKSIFDACMAWSENACKIKNLDPLEMKNRRKQLGDCFHLIQFAVMKPLHISQCISRYDDLFKREELKEIVAILSLDNAAEMQYFHRTTRAHCNQWNERAILMFSQIDSSHGYLKQVETTIFKTNKKLLLGSIGTPIINTWKSDKQELSSIMTIVDLSCEDKTLLEQPFVMALGGSFIPRNLAKLNKPIIIEPNRTYKIRIEFDSSWSNEVYVTKKCENAQTHSLREYTILIGGGIVSHMYFN